MKLIEWYTTHAVEIATISTGLLMISEVLASSEKVKSNAIYQVIVTLLRKLSNKK